MKIIPRVLFAASLVTIPLVVAGCSTGSGTAPAPSSSGSSSSAAGPVAGEVADGEYAGRQFSFVGYGGTPQDLLMARFQEFADKAGAAVVGDAPADEAKLRAQVDSGNVTWDIVATSSVNAERDCGTLYQPWDYSKIDTSNLPEGIKATDCGVPQTSFSTGLAYNTEAFSTAPTSYADFFDTKKFPGKRSLYSTDAEMNLEIALLADGVKQEDLYPLDLDRAFAKLDTIRDDLVFFATGAEQEQILESDRASICLCWTGRVFAVNEKGSAWAFAPEAPMVARETVYSNVKGSKNGDVASAAMNFLMGKEMQERAQEESAYPALYVGADPTLSDNAKAVDFLKPPYVPFIPMDIDYWVAEKAAILDEWVSWTSGS